MRGRSWRSHAVAVAVLAIQLGVSVLGVAGMCVDRPHTHGGIPAPDCLMHMSDPASTTPEATNHTHHHHGSNTPTNSAQLTCSCSSDPLTLLTTEIAVVAIGVSIDLPNPVTLSSPERSQSAPEMRLAPLSPPPRPSLS
ncbi:MAG TPA: hypothetical protein VMS40_23165 [Vicinamibacterales bacterium]|nr:hypothetical protein [Vicinamibacterales bacterium]